jgi:hypothetical protein
MTVGVMLVAPVSPFETVETANVYQDETQQQFQVVTTRK